MTKIKKRRQEYHGLCPRGGRSREYNCWVNMTQRCHNPNHKEYPKYGGRGIFVCKKWRESFTAFLSDVGKCPAKEFSLDRIKNQKGYFPGNTRWTDLITQLNNTRKNKYYTYKGEKLTIAQWARKLNIHKDVLRERLVRGQKKWTVAEAFETPVKCQSIIRLTYKGETHTISEWGDRLGLNKKYISHRIYRGWSVERALEYPIIKRK